MSRHLILRWATLKGLAAIVLFLIIAALLEYAIVIYAISLGVKEENPLQGSFQFPWTNWTITIVVSPLFHLVPLAVIITLVFSWICMTKYAATQPQKPPEGKAKAKPRKMGQNQKAENKPTSKIASAIKNFFSRIKAGLLRVKGVSYIWSKVSFARATIKSATITILVFSSLILLVSVVAYPELIYGTFSNIYCGNPSLLGFVKSVNNALKGFVEALGPISWLCSAINNAIISAAPDLRGFVSALGGFVKPLVDLPPVGKYIVFQNVAAWVSALAVFSYGFLTRKGYRFRKAKRS
ncbi:hypothetical protein KEJ37_00670 [Candidatus Bathyarchaeota archaeon]|nr:hypothetical protein [Candidatus Bathyarchaeota archaeon]